LTDINYIGPDDGVTRFLIPLGKINQYHDSKDSNLFVLPFPGEDAGKTEAVDSLGIVNYINIEGTLTGNFHDIQTIISQLKILADGFQMTGYAFMSPFITASVFTGGASNVVRGNIGFCTSSTPSKLIDSNAQFLTWNTRIGDKVKNMQTGSVANVTSIDTENQISLDADLGFVTGVQYGLTATMWVKVLSISPRWELPGLGFCNYTLNLVQVVNNAS